LSVVGGGISNTASGTCSFVGGGQSNTAAGTHAVIGGGCGNISCNCGTVGGGNINCATAIYSSVLGGTTVKALGSYSVAVGGASNSSSGYMGFLGGGRTNTINGLGNYAVLVGGYNNFTINSFTSVVGGYLNCAISSNSSIVGGLCNCTPTSAGAFIGGGLLNTASGLYSSIVGGRNNTAQAIAGFIGSGNCNFVCNSTSGCLAYGAVVVGGVGNNTTGGTWDLATCVFTVAPTVCNAGAYSFVGGGLQNVACGQYSAVSGGFQAKTYLYGQHANASGQFSAVGDAQSSYMVARKVATLNASDTSIMSLDGTGVTGLIIPDGNNRSWNVTVEWVIVCTVLGTGTSGSLAVGGTHTGTDTFYFVRVGGTSSISAITNVSSHNTSGMASSDVTITVGASQELQLTLVAPTTAGTGSTFRAVANVRIVEVAW
jgi:hypothetical protein